MGSCTPNGNTKPLGVDRYGDGSITTPNIWYNYSKYSFCLPLSNSCCQPCHYYSWIAAALKLGGRSIRNTYSWRMLRMLVTVPVVDQDMIHPLPMMLSCLSLFMIQAIPWSLWSFCFIIIHIWTMNDSGPGLFLIITYQPSLARLTN